MEEKRREEARQFRSIPIIDGFAEGDYYQIMPVGRLPDGCTKMKREAMISVELCYAEQFLYYFLDGIFDDDYPNRYLREGDSADAEWYLEYHVYPYKAVEDMLLEIEQYAHLLKTDFDHPKVSDLKKWFESSSFCLDESDHQKFWTTEEKEMLIRENIGVAVDFYERFVLRMRKMMKEASDYDLISFYSR